MNSIMKLSDFATLADAKAYTETKGSLIPRVTMNSLLAQFGLFNAFINEASTDDRFAAFMHATSTEYNFIQGTTTGDAQIAMLDDIIISNAFPALTSLKPVIISMANKTVYPFANASQYEFDLAKGNEITKKPLTHQQGWAFITTTADCEKHNPQILKKIGEHYVRVASFSGVESAGEYKAQVPNGELYVHDAYGVIQ